MAKDKEKSEIPKMPGETKISSEDYVSVVKQGDSMVGVIDPLMQIAIASVGVAKGASVVELRRVVVENVPEDRGLYVTQIRRMRDAADTALTLAQELASGV